MKSALQKNRGRMRSVMQEIFRHQQPFDRYIIPDGGTGRRFKFAV